MTRIKAPCRAAVQVAVQTVRGAYEMEEVCALAACQPTAQPQSPDVRATQMSK